MNLALKIQDARERRQTAPDSQTPLPPPFLRLAYDADRPTVSSLPPEPRRSARLSIADNKAFAFMLLISVLVGLSIGSYVAGWNDRVMTDARARVVELADAALPSIMQQSGTFDRERGR